MAAALPLLFEPTPSSVEEIVQRLPASARASIEWFPQALRNEFITPLSLASRSRFPQVLDDVTVAAVRVFLRLFANLGDVAKLFEDEALSMAIRNEARKQERHRLIATRLDPVDVAAADSLREAYEWLDAVLAATAIAVRAEQASVGSVADRVGSIADEQIRQEVGGEAGAFWRGLLLTVAALDLVLEGGPLPESIVEWCTLALTEMHATANVLRAAGVAVPTEIQIPGFTPEAWRQHRATRSATRKAATLLSFEPRSEPCPPGVISRLVETMNPEEIWLFGSRARGTAQPDSDWDLLVVLPDSAPTALDEVSTWAALRDVRRQRVDMFSIRRSDFEAQRRALGSLAQIASTEGQVVYAR